MVRPSQVELYAAIRRDARAGVSGRQLQRNTLLVGARCRLRWLRPGLCRGHCIPHALPGWICSKASSTRF